MNIIIKNPIITLSPLKLQSVSTVHVTRGNENIFYRKQRVVLPKIKLHTTSKFYIPGCISLFDKKPSVRLSPIKPSVLRRFGFRNIHSGHKLFSSISKCNMKRCCTCKYLSCKSTIKSTVNGRVFNANIPSDVS